MKSCSSHRLFVLLAFAVAALANGISQAADREQMLDEIHLADLEAAAEEAVERAVAERSAQKLVRLQLLQTNGLASWREVAEAKSTSARDAARLAAIEQFRKWMRGLRGSLENVSPGVTPEITSVARLDLTLPGSRGILGWVRPERLRSSQRDELLDLMTRRSAMLAESTHGAQVERCRLKFFAKREDRLRLQPHIPDRELDEAHSQLQTTRARLQLAEAVQERRRREHELLVSAIAELRSMDVADNEASDRGEVNAGTVAGFDADQAERHRERLLAVLAYEAGTEGELDLARSARHLANFVSRGSDALRRDDHISFTAWQQAERDLGRSRMEWERLGAWKEWQARWEDQIRRTSPAVKPVARVGRDEMQSARPMDCEPGFELASACRRDRPLARKGILLARQWFDACSERDAAQAELDWRTEFVQRLRQQTDPNPREIVAAEYTVEFCAGRVRVAAERAGLVRLLYDQIAASAEEGAAFQLSLIGDAEAALILDSFAQRAARNDPASRELAIAQEKRWVEGLKQLRALGHASMDELARAELSLDLKQIDRDTVRSQRRIAELDGQLMERLLTLRQSLEIAGEPVESSE